MRPLNNKELSADYRNIVHVDNLKGSVQLDQVHGHERSRDAPPKVHKIFFHKHFELIVIRPINTLN